MSRLWFALRLARVLLHLVVGLWTCAVIFPFADVTGRRWRIRQWSVELLAICRVQVTLRNPDNNVAPTRALIVANHVSWLDIFAINSIQTCSFVGKSDIRDWPLLGWLCEKGGTIFIARGKQRDVRRIFQGLVTSIQAGERVAFFPEGTTAAQGTLLPFHANLFEAALDAQVPVQPYALCYLNPQGALHPAADFIGDMTFAQSMISILQGEPMKAELIQLAPIETAGLHRRQLAASAQALIAEALEQSQAEKVSAAA
jgi:1-acyl-sn-glycerol-3-phosphate acyltransferase